MKTDYHYIGKRISQRRHELGLKQSAVEEKAGIGYKYLSNIERGISIPSIEVIMKIASVLNTTPDYFLLGADTNTNKTELMIMLVRNLPSDKSDTAISFLKWLNEN